MTEQLAGNPPTLLDIVKGEITPLRSVWPLTLLACAHGVVMIIVPEKAPPF